MTEKQPRKAARASHDALVRLVGIAVFAALAFIAELVFRFPVAFLTFDAKDAVITVASLVYGPVAAVGMSLATALVEMVSVSATGFWGFLMNFLSSAAFSAPAALLYRRRRSVRGAVIGLYVGAAAMCAVMLPLNLLITPLYTGATAGEVARMIPTLLLPFNAAKGLVNAALTLLLYKPVSVALKRARLVADREHDRITIGKDTLSMAIAAGVTLTLGVLVYIFVLK